MPHGDRECHSGHMAFWGTMNGRLEQAIYSLARQLVTDKGARRSPYPVSFSSQLTSHVREQPWT